MLYLIFILWLLGDVCYLSAAKFLRNYNMHAWRFLENVMSIS